MNCGFGPLRNSVPSSSRGRSPVTGRCGASHSVATGAKLPVNQGTGAASAARHCPVRSRRCGTPATGLWCEGSFWASRLLAATSADAINGVGAGPSLDSGPKVRRYSPDTPFVPGRSTAWMTGQTPASYTLGGSCWTFGRGVLLEDGGGTSAPPENLRSAAPHD